MKIKPTVQTFRRAYPAIELELKNDLWKINLATHQNTLKGILGEGSERARNNDYTHHCYVSVTPSLHTFTIFIPNNRNENRQIQFFYFETKLLKIKFH